MISPQWFHKELKERGVRFFTGVPDSLLKPFCNVVQLHEEDSHIIAANEGAAVGIAAGHFLGSGRPALVYLQNSGLGNLVNPLVSLTSPEVYGIPMLLLIGWRGEPDRPDEPQHLVQGRVTLPMLECLNVPHAVLPSNEEAISALLNEAFSTMHEEQSPFALVVPKGIFESVDFKPESLSGLSRESAIAVIAEALPPNASIVATTGKISRELYEYRQTSNTKGQGDFLTVGSMGHASAIALGLARSRPNHPVICLDGDGAMLMHLGTLATVATVKPKNLTHIVLNNGCHESVGGLPSAASTVDLSEVLRAVGYPTVARVSDVDTLKNALSTLSTNPAQGIEVIVASDSRSDLGRPKRSPREAKRAFMDSFDAP